METGVAECDFDKTSCCQRFESQMAIKSSFSIFFQLDWYFKAFVKQSCLTSENSDFTKTTVWHVNFWLLYIMEDKGRGGGGLQCKVYKYIYGSGASRGQRNKVRQISLIGRQWLFGLSG